MIIHFIRPLWLMTFIPAILYLFWVIFANRQKNPWQNLCDAHLLPALILENKPSSRRFFYFSLLIFLSLAIFALAGPSWKKAQLPIYRDLSSLMLVLDLSSSMQSTDLKPDRLTRAKFKIRDLINNSQNTQMGLVVFSGEAFIAAPLSQDANTLHTLLDELHPQMMPLPGSDMAQGLTQGLALLKQTVGQRGIVLLITASVPTANSWKVAKAISESGNQLNVFTTLENNSQNESIIKDLDKLAQIGGGALYRFTADGTDIQNILKNKHAIQTMQDANVETSNLWLDAGPWFCLLLIPFALLVLREKAL